MDIFEKEKKDIKATDQIINSICDAQSFFKYSGLVKGDPPT